MGRKGRDKKGKGPDATTILDMVPFLWRYVRPLKGPLLLAVLATACYAGFDAVRAPLAGLFAEKVFFQQEEASEDALISIADQNDATIRATRERLLASHPEVVAERERAGGAAPAPAAADAAEVGLIDEAEAKRKLSSWADRNIPLVARVKAWWHEKTLLFSWRDWLYIIAGLLVVLAVGMGVSNIFKATLQQAFVLRVLIAIRLHVTEHLLKQGLGFFHRHRLGDLYSRLTNDIGGAHSALQFLFIDIFESFLRILAYLVVCVWASWKLSVGALFVAPPVVLLMRVFGKKIRKRSRGRQVSAAEVTEEMQQMLSGIRTVKAFHNEARQVERFEAANMSFYKRALRVVRVKALSRGVVELINHWAVAIILVVGTILVFDKGIASRDALITFVGALALMYNPAKKMVRAYNNLSDALASMERLQELLQEEPAIQDRADATDIGEVRGEVELRGVTFAYETDPVLHEISLVAKPGTVVALVGESGGGKSTLVDLIARFYDPQDGAILVDGHDIRNVTRASYMRHVAMVTQDPFLFNDTVATNLRYAKPDATLEEMVAACKAARIHDAITELESGYDTVVGERGVMLSGGQRQRLTIARALLKNPKVLLLDEATSALDSESEKLVQQALERLMQGRTTIAIAHRIGTIMGADQILVIDRGRIVETGTHETLLAEQGRYANLYALQT
ncbi:MAG: ABC transporter ATP-binding protein [Planctomycetota bacterium]